MKTKIDLDIEEDETGLDVIMGAEVTEEGEFTKQEAIKETRKVYDDVIANLRRQIKKMQKDKKEMVEWIREA